MKLKKIIKNNWKKYYYEK